MISLKILAGTLLTIQLCAVSLLHFYWAAGGKAFSTGVFPEIERLKGMEANIPIIPTIIVGIGLGMMATVVMMNVGWLNFEGWGNIARICLWIIAGIFMLRAIGDFNYVGLFKRKKKGLFAEKDTKYYAPLCLSMSVFALMVLLLP